MAKKVIILLILFCSIFADAQKNLKDFYGDLIFKETSYYFPIDRKLFDTSISYSIYSINKMIEIEQIAPSFNNRNGLEINYTPINFFNNRDTIFCKITNPFNKGHDTTIMALFPLRYKDTLLSNGCYRITLDTIHSSNKQLYVETECVDENNDYKTFYSGDTTIYFRDYKLDCYKVTQIEASKRTRKFRRILLIEKNTLIPIDVKEYNFYFSRRFRTKPIGQNLLTKHQKLIEIE